VANLIGSAPTGVQQAPQFVNVDFRALAAKRNSAEDSRRCNANDLQASFQVFYGRRIGQVRLDIIPGFIFTEVIRFEGPEVSDRPDQDLSTRLDSIRQGKETTEGGFRL
jgi:hypothetical protein